MIRNVDDNNLDNLTTKDKSKPENDLDNDIVNNDLLTTENLKSFIPKLIECYYGVRKMYLEYVLNNFEVEKVINSEDNIKGKCLENLSNPNSEIENNNEDKEKSYFGSIDYIESDDKVEYSMKGFRISGVTINIKKDLDQTLKVKHLEKHSSQGEALVNVMKNFGLLDVNNTKDSSNNEISTSDQIDKNIKNLFIEFGAGKGGLTEKIVLEFQKDKIEDSSNYYLLLERDGIRYKKDKITKNSLRIRTDILDYEINSSNKVIEEIDERNNVLNLNNEYILNAIGIAKHICGCALDMSATCLSRISKNTNLKNNGNNKIEIDNNINFKGLCFATCCHQRSHLNHFLGYELIKNNFSFTDLDFLLLFKCTSWTFESKNGDMSEKYKKVLKNQLEKKKIGLMCKYIVDLSRCLYLVNKGMNVFYLKYISNHITTENNVILCINKC